MFLPTVPLLYDGERYLLAKLQERAFALVARPALGTLDVCAHTRCAPRGAEWTK
jgi:hypothetical protein